MKTLNLQNFLENRIECFSTNLDETEFTNVIKQQDIIICQPIWDNYRDKPYLSTKFIIRNCKESCKIIIVDSCYFNFYYFDLTYNLFNEEKTLDQPILYHYNKMMECYKNNASAEYFLENIVNNKDLKTKEELENYANESLEELRKRYLVSIQNYKINDNIHIITCYDYIKNNYKDKLLFYSFNHPTKFVIQFICEQIIQILNMNNTIDYNVDELNYIKCIIYKCIQKAVNFNVIDFKPLTCKKQDIKKITELYYDAYRNNGF
jgi:hypothetical protein